MSDERVGAQKNDYTFKTLATRSLLHRCGKPPLQNNISTACTYCIFVYECLYVGNTEKIKQDLLKTFLKFVKVLNGTNETYDTDVQLLFQRSKRKMFEMF